MDAWSGSHPPTKTLPFHGDMTKGRICHVPAFFGHSKGPSSEPQPQYYTIAAIWTISFWSWLICFPSNLHVSGFSSCRINIMIHSYLVCVCVWAPGGCACLLCGIAIRLLNVITPPHPTGNWSWMSSACACWTAKNDKVAVSVCAQEHERYYPTSTHQ